MMTFFKSWQLMILALLLASGCALLQKNQPVTAEETGPPRTVMVDPGALSDHPLAAMPTVQMEVGGKTFTLEVAGTSEQMQRGLMFRTELPGDRGMLFPFEPARRVHFWMKNTRIPLDMVFIRDGRIVNITHQAQPCTGDPCRYYPSVVPVDRVIELPGGTAEALSLQLGDPVRPVLPEKPQPAPPAAGNPAQTDPSPEGADSEAL